MVGRNRLKEKSGLLRFRTGKPISLIPLISYPLLNMHKMS